MASFQFTDNQPAGYSIDMMINFPDMAKIVGKKYGVASDESAGSNKGRWQFQRLELLPTVCPPTTVATSHQSVVYNSH